jgi:hypothetical protein
MRRAIGSACLLLIALLGAPTWGDTASIQTNPPTPKTAFQVTCPTSADAYGKYRDALVNYAMTEGEASVQSISNSLQSCFSNKEIPACLGDLGTAVLPPDVDHPDPQMEQMGKSLKLPDAFYKAGQPGIHVPDNIDELAQKNHWVTVDFKTRGQGGFDESTSSLKIIEIPGKSLNPPQKVNWYIQWALKQPPGTDPNDPVPSSKEDSKGQFAAIAVYHRPDGKVTPFYYNIDDGGGLEPRMHGGLEATSNDGCHDASGDDCSESCLDCHMNGLREISPKGYYSVAGEKRLDPVRRAFVDQINEDMETETLGVDNKGNPILHKINHGYFVKGMGNTVFYTDGHGPAFGDKFAADPSLIQMLGTPATRTKDFILGKPPGTGCAFEKKSFKFADALGRPGNGRDFQMSDKPNIDFKKVAAAMNCSRCHDGSARSSLDNFNTTSDTLVTKVLLDDSMPIGTLTTTQWIKGLLGHGTAMNIDERIALVNCLRAEKKVQYGPWLKDLVDHSVACAKPDDSNCPDCGVKKQNGDGTLDKMMNGLKSIEDKF